MALTKAVRRWRDGMQVSGDTEYCTRLENLSGGSVRRNFNPYLDIPWDSPEFEVTENDPRWVLAAESDPIGSSPWYQALPLEKQIAIGMWRQANVAKAGLQFENMLIRGILNYTFWVPNGSPEYRYCLHEAVEECNHTLMFQEMVNHAGVDVPGLARWLRWMHSLPPLFASPMPVFFFTMVLCGEEPIDHMQKSILREGKPIHPIMERVMAIHVAEEARQAPARNPVHQRRRFRCAAGDPSPVLKLRWPLGAPARYGNATPDRRCAERATGSWRSDSSTPCPRQASAHRHRSHEASPWIRVHAKRSPSSPIAGSRTRARTSAEAWR
ncbi:AurF N-oxygenase family protein [Mycolicibacterium fortuitum]|uniref:AurF N-oxygenase family protein n=1 Tax=Mycolicibacterium fortuitum TaxID=1766 RepID=UPI000A70B75D|nr:diiron oxygenase [Mycolicibacterium fortuitum]